MTQIPGIYVAIKGNYTALQKDLEAAKALVTNQSKGMSDALNNALSPKQIQGNMKGLINILSTLQQSSKITGDSFKHISVDLGDLRRHTGLTEKQLNSLQQRMLQTRATNSQEYALKKIARSANLTEKEIAQMGRQFGLSAAQIAKVTGATNTASASMSRFGGVAKAALTYVTVSSLINVSRSIIETADQYALLDSKIALVTEGSREFNGVYAELFKISQDTGSSFANNASNYSNLSLALKDTNITSAESLKIFELINKSLVVAGASTEEASSFMLQFRQALGSGVLQGEEFRAMMEANSYFGGQLAKALGTDVAGLRAMSKEGKLTTDVLRKAFPVMAEQIDQSFSKISKTIGRAKVELSNAFAAVIADANKSSDGTSKVASAISGLATTITDNREALSSAFSGMIKSASAAVKFIGKIDTAISSIGKKRTALALREELGGLNEELYRAKNGWLGMGKASEGEIKKIEGKVQSLRELIKDVEDGSLYAPRNKAPNVPGIETGKGNKNGSPPPSPDGNKSNTGGDKTKTDSILDGYDKIDSALTKYFRDLDTASEKESKRLAAIRESTEATNIHILALNGIEAAKSVPMDSWQRNFELREEYQAESLKKMADKEKTFAEEAKDAVNGWASGFSQSLNDMLWSADVTFAGILESFGKMITQMVIQQAIVKPMVAGMLSFMPSAQGNVFAGAGISAYSNRIVSQPTVFPFARGIGLMGEAGAEAVMPLKRMPGGNLGVESSGGRSITNVTVINKTDGTATTTERQNESGGIDIEVLIDSAVAKNIGRFGSASNKAIRQTTGAGPQLVRR